MKSKSTLITLLLVVALLVLGIAYAALAGQTLTVGGTATVATSGANFDVEFTDKAVGDGTSAGVTVTPTINVDGNEDKASMDISGFTTKGQKAVATFEITNTSAIEDVFANLSVGIKSIVDSDDANDWFQISAELDSNASRLAKDDTSTLTITVELLKTPISESDEGITGTIDVQVTASPVE